MKKDENGIYYGSAHNDAMFKRYYKIADEIIVATRVTNVTSVDAKKRFSEITIKPIKFIECPNISSIRGQIFNKNKTKKLLDESIKNVDYVVTRFPSALSNIAFDIAKNYNIPCLVEVVGCAWDAYFNYSLKGKLVAPFA